MLSNEAATASTSSRGHGVRRAAMARAAGRAATIELHDDEQRIHAGDRTPGGVALHGSTTGREAGQSTETADPSGPMGGAMSVTRTSLAPLGGTPSAPAAIPERSGAGCRR
jgi:hypothetical protein